GATCQAADLDNDGRQEVLIAAALNRAGGVLAPFNAGGSSDGVGGTAHGSLYIVWDDNFPAGRWPDTFVLRVGSAGLVHSTIDGGQRNAKFGEEILGGLDYDADGRADLFVGDLTTDLSPGGTQPDSGAGYVFYDASQLKGQTFSLDAPPGALRLSVMFGEIRGAITGDTAIDGDFDGDGIADLAVGSPHAAPLDRQDAGVLHVFFGKPGGWPAVIDVSRLDQIPALRSTEVLGARGWVPGNDGDVLGYSIAAGDVNGDGRSDIVINEMEGDGLAAKTIDVGNLLVLDGALVATAVDRVDCPIQPRDDCRAAAGGSSSLRVHQEQRRLRWRWRAATAADLPPPPASYAVCLYDSASRALRGILELEPPSVCESCWSDPVAGVRRYRGPTTGTTVVQSAVFRGGSGRRPQFELRARDWRSTLAEGPWSLPATVQLIGADRCWQAEFGSPRRNDGHQLLARQPRR
ncbi:MAG TPA: VCBS repeat-containing protein, partial [Terriglobales bacterium]|nr:VCBS repeat-containing protein [Terriglobales bacterium]